MSRTARARLKRFEDLPPEHQCCEGMRESITDTGDIEFDIIVGSGHDYSWPCDNCGKVHEGRGVSLASPVKKCGRVAVEFIEIAEG